MRGQYRGPLRRLRHDQSSGRALLPEVRRCPRRRRHTFARALAGGIHTALPDREDPHLSRRARRRAQAGDGALRRRQGIAGARPQRRRRGLAPGARPLLRDPRRRRPPLRGNDQPVHGRRDHGALRRSDRTRGPRAARVFRGARDPRRAGGILGRAPPHARPQLLDADGAQLRRGRGREDRRRSPDGLYRARAHGRARGEDAGARRAGEDLPGRDDRVAGLGVLRAQGSRPLLDQGRGAEPPSLRAPRRGAPADALRCGARAGTLAVRRPRHRDGPPRGQPRRRALGPGARRRRGLRGRDRQEPALLGVRRALSLSRHHRARSARRAAGADDLAAADPRAVPRLLRAA